MSGPLDFLASNTHLATRNLKFLTEIEQPHAVKTIFSFCFGLHLNFGPRFWTEIKLLSLTKLRKNISPPRNLFNQQKIDTYVWCSLLLPLTVFVSIHGFAFFVFLLFQYVNCELVN